MNDDVDSVATRPRPLSGGFWTIFSWLRRDERDSSSESISSAGSDRTAASFAFLKPVNYSVNNTNNVLPTLGPPTDSYKKRVHERNVRRQYERDLTLHRKYGLYRSEGGTGYDTFTLQQYRRIDGDSLGKWSRERRAASEGLQRRSVHVPGKRRAPLPPTSPASLEGSVTLARRTRKRRAPPPPAGTIQQLKENTELNNILPEMSSLNYSESSVQTSDDISTDCKFEKYVKKDTNHKDTKNRPEKSFLRQIFENRKKNSATDTVSIKLLPSISELDKQAAEIIETGRLKTVQQNRIISDEIQGRRNTDPQDTKSTKRESWFCTKCLKKYDASVKECSYCFPKLKDETVEPVMNLMPYLKSEIYTQTDNDSVHPSSSNHHKIEDKQKLKEILKEMKDSLPKRSKNEKDFMAITQNNAVQENSIEKRSINSSETPTLRIGSIETPETPYDDASSSGVEKDNNLVHNQTPYFKVPNIEHVKLEQTANSINNVKSVKSSTRTSDILIKLPQHKALHNIDSEKVNIDKHDNISKIASSSIGRRDLHTPLRISALLNPVYIPKNKDYNKPPSKEPLPKGSVNLDIKTNTINKADIVPTTVSLDSGTSNITLSGSVMQMKNSNVDTPKLKLESNESTLQPRMTTLKDEVKVDRTKIIIHPKPSISPKNEMAPLTDASIQLNPVKSYCKENTPNNSPSSSVLPTPASVGNNTSILSSNIERVNQHIRRRELVNQLEKSIAKGDENAAADAAVKLAQLRLSCSVLSFSSQIVAESMSSPLEMSVNIIPTICEENEKATNTIQPTNKNESENKKSKVQLHIVNKAKTSQPAPISLSINKNNSVQGVKEKAALTAQQQSMKSEIENKNKDLYSQGTASADIETLKEKKNINNVSIQVWVEDKEATRGPIHLNTRRQAVMGELRIQAEIALGLPSQLQRWIVGRTLCTDDNIPIVTLAGPEFNAPFYLCLVEAGHADGNKPCTSSVKVSEKQNTTEAITQQNIKTIGPAIVKAVKQETIKAIGQNNVKVQDTIKVMMQNEDHAVNVYKELVKLEQQAIVPNAEAFECGVCMDECQTDQGVVLRECVHTFCRDCLSNLVRHCEDPDVFCPAMGCRGMLQEREIRGLVSPEDYERWLARGLAAAESGTRNAFHCRTRDCTGWALCDPGVQKFPCPVCSCTNCIPCQAIHKNESCEDYRARLQSVANIGSDQIDASTRALINTLIKKGEALECPECKAVITKKWGCDWVKCSACKTEICWVTRGKRWGPAGRGDTSGGCRCGIDGKKCHPSCGYCH